MGSHECGDEPLGAAATEFVSWLDRDGLDMLE